MIETILYIGLVTAIDRCVNFDCTKVAAPMSECQMRTKFQQTTAPNQLAGAANYEGKIFDMWSFKSGNREGFSSSKSDFSLVFINNSSIGTVYLDHYHDRDTYTRYTCTIKQAVRE
jgi:hypothetical protein